MSDSPSEQALHWLSQDSHSIIKGWLNFVMTCKDRPAIRVSSHVICLVYSLCSQSAVVPLIYSQIYWLLLYLINLSLFYAADHWIKVIYKSAEIKFTLWNTINDVSILWTRPWSTPACWTKKDHACVILQTFTLLLLRVICLLCLQ